MEKKSCALDTGLNMQAVGQMKDIHIIFTSVLSLGTREERTFNLEKKGVETLHVF